MTTAERPLRAFELVEAVARLLSDALVFGAGFEYTIRHHLPPGLGGHDIHIVIGPRPPGGLGECGWDYAVPPAELPPAGPTVVPPPGAGAATRPGPGGG